MASQTAMEAGITLAQLWANDETTYIAVHVWPAMK